MKPCSVVSSSDGLTPPRALRIHFLSVCGLLTAGASRGGDGERAASTWGHVCLRDADFLLWADLDPEEGLVGEAALSCEDQGLKFTSRKRARAWSPPWGEGMMHHIPDPVAGFRVDRLGHAAETGPDSSGCSGCFWTRQNADQETDADWVWVGLAQSGEGRSRTEA